MLKKEFQDSVKILFESCLLLLSLPFLLLMNNRFFRGTIFAAELAQVLVLLTIMIYAVYSGLSLFYGEEKQGSYEYLFTLPISRSKILFYKIFPRLLILSLLLFIFSLFFVSGNETLFVKNHDVYRTIIVAFFLAMFFSLAFRSLVTGIAGTFILLVLYDRLLCFFINIFYEVFYRKHYEQFPDKDFDLIWEVLHILPGLLIMIPLAISFFLAYKRLDLKPVSDRIKPYLYIALPAFLALTVMVVVLPELIDSIFF